MENKKKAKGTVLSLVLSILLVLNLVVCGVAIALSVANVTLGGSITFNAKHVNATISQGTVDGGTLNGTGKMQAITLNAENDGADEIATWSGLDLEFNESGDDVTISFTITNNSEEFDLKSALTTTAGTQDNATMTVSAEKIEIVNEGTPTYTTLTDLSNVVIAKYDADTKTQTCVAYTITFKVTDKNKSASISGFALNFSLEKFVLYNVSSIRNDQVSYCLYCYFGYMFYGDNALITIGSSPDSDEFNITDIDRSANTNLMAFVFSQSELSDDFSVDWTKCNLGDNHISTYQSEEIVDSGRYDDENVIYINGVECADVFFETSPEYIVVFYELTQDTEIVFNFDVWWG